MGELYRNFANSYCPSSIKNSQIPGISSKGSNDMMYMKPNEKLQSLAFKLCGRSYMHISIIVMCHFI